MAVEVIGPSHISVARRMSALAGSDGSSAFRAVSALPELAPGHIVQASAPPPGRASGGDVAACLKSDVEHALIRRSRLRQKLGNRDMELLVGGRQTGAGAVTLDEFYFEV
jgi:hypothetical protein